MSHTEIGTAKRVWLISICVTLVVALAAALWITRRILLLLFAAVLFAIVLSAITAWLGRRLHLRRAWALTLAVFLVLLAFSLTAWLVGDRVTSQVQMLSQQLPDAVANLHQRLAQHPWGQALLRSMPSFEDLLSNTSRLVSRSWSAIWGLFGILGSALLIFFVGLYLAATPSLYCTGLLRLFPISARPHVASTLQQAGHSLAHWLLGKLCLMCFVGVFTAIGLSLLGIPLALTLALLAAALDFIPNIGPLASAVPALLLALLQGPTTALWVMLLYVIVQVVESYILAPLVQRRAVSLPPALLLGAQVLLPMLFGFPGLLLATPVTVLLLVVVRNLYVEAILEPHPQPLNPS